MEKPSLESRIVISKAKPADLGAISALWVQLVRHHQRLERHFWPMAPDGRARYQAWMRKTLKNRKRVLWIAKDGGRVVGFTHALLHRTHRFLKRSVIGFITDLAVHEPYRRRGIGRELFRTVEDWLVSHGADDIRLSLAPINKQACVFWKQMGFKPYIYDMWKAIPRKPSKIRRKKP
jgi:ribosomal protein S18 acetylase RimI-like enzyme